MQPQDTDSQTNYNISQASEGFPEIAKASLLTMAGTAIAVSIVPTLEGAIIGTLVGAFVAAVNYMDNDLIKSNRASRGHNDPY
jgi:hypothetical protein